MRKVFSVTILSGLVTLMKMIVGFIIAKVVAIYTGPSGMALLGQAQSLTVAANGLINAPASSAVVKFTAENSESYDKCSPWWRASVSYVLGICIVVIPLGCILSKEISFLFFKDPSYYYLVIAATLSLPFVALGTLVISVLNGTHNYRKYTWTGVLSGLFSGAITVAGTLYYGMTGALVSVTIQYGLIGILAIAINFNEPWLKLRYWFGKTNIKYRKDIGEFLLMALISSVMLPLALVLIRNFMASKAGWDGVGQWQAVWKISEVYLSLITLSMSVYYLPKLANMNGLMVLKREIKSTMIFLLPISILFAGLVFLLRDEIIKILFTSSFDGARDLFLIQLIGDVLKVVSWLYAYPMIARKKTKWFIFTELLFTITWVLLSFIFVQYNGVHGANQAYLLNYLLYFLFLYMTFNKIHR
ncbi:Lipid III flippase [Erwinia aphidicola]|uniref:O-antigen translocase n=1 Tax=Erwinia aphidicola TaxID=68334 RepID=UPI001D1EEA8C|nr:O-antigen translocase [Erwinia aphidicola]CAH0230634.1 Lipid III flippase [Erwinia aphidicola]